MTAAVDEALSSETLDWLREVFAAATRGPSFFDPATFGAFARAFAKGVPHDRLVVLVREPSTTAVRLTARATQTGSVGVIPVGSVIADIPPEFVAMFDRREVVVSDGAASAPAIEAFLAAQGVRSFALAPIPLANAAIAACLVVGWERAGGAAGVSRERLERAARMISAFVPAAHHATRASRLAATLDRLPYGIVGLDRAARIVELNAAARALLADADPAPHGREFYGLVAPASRDALREALATPRATALVLELAAPQGGRPLDVRVTPVPDDDLFVHQLHVEDARPRLASDAELARRAEALAFLRELAETVTGELDSERALHRATSLVIERLPVRGAAIARVTHDGDRLALLATRGVSAAIVRKLLVLPPRALAESRDAALVSDELRAAAGDDRDVVVMPLRHADQLLGAAAFVVARGDAAVRELLVASARTMALALHASTEYLEAVRLASERRQLLDSIPSIVFRLDATSGATLYANAAVERVLGTPVGDALGLPGLEGLLCDHAERQGVFAARIAVASGGESAWVDRRFRHRDGRTLVLRTRLYRVDGAAGSVIEGIAQDVTDEIEARKQLIQADRLASLGMLAAGVAHEINNPTAFILLGVQQLGRMAAQLPDDDARVAPVQKRMKEVLGEVSDGVQRIVQIVGELKFFTRIPERAFSTPVDVNRLLVSAVTLAQAELRHRARVEVDLGDLPPLPGDHARLGQVFVNLLINAAQAIPPGDEDGNVVRVRTRAADGVVVVEVSDTGVGISPDHLPRIFDPFFTTKAPGEGTGLGLAISFDLVRRAGGTISVSSEVGRGTRFVVQLPVREAGLPRESRPRVAPVPAGARVLIVEDEQHLAVAIARALATTYLVQLAPDAHAALARIEAADEPYDAVLCDLRMPGMDGRALYEAVRARWPAQAARFVFLTGAGLGSEFEPFVREIDRPVLEKPFEMSELEEVVAQVVVGEGAAIRG